VCAACLKYSALIFVEKNIYLMQHLEGSGTPVLYIGRRFLKVNAVSLCLCVCERGGGH
jgi:hypothetical protein